MTTKKDTTKAEQAKLDAEKVEAAKVAEAKAEAEKAEQAKAEQAKLDAEKAEADAKAKANKEAQAKAEQAEADAKAKAEKEAKAEPVEIKPWNGEPLMPAPEGETVENAKAAPLKPAKTSGKTYIAQWTLHHDNTRYVTGDTLTLSDDDAEDLVDAGVLVAAK